MGAACLSLMLATILACAGATAERTILVGSSVGASSRTIQGGVNLVPDMSVARWTVQIEPGLYNERVHIDKTKGPLTLVGLGGAKTVVLTHACPGGDGTGKPGCKPCPPFNTSSGPTPGMRADVTTMLVQSDDFIAVTPHPYRQVFTPTLTRTLGESHHSQHCVRLQRKACTTI